MISHDEDLKVVLSTENGRRFLFQLMELAGTDTQVFTGDVQRDTFNAGRRDLGLFVEREVRRTDFDLYIKMLRENHNGT